MLHKMALAADAFPAFPQALRLSGGGRCPSCSYNLGVSHSQRKDNQPLNEDTLGYIFGIHWRYPSHLNTKKLQGNHSPKCIKLSHGGLLQLISFGCLIRYNIQLKADHPLPAFLAHTSGELEPQYTSCQAEGGSHPLGTSQWGYIVKPYYPLDNIQWQTLNMFT